MADQQASTLAFLQNFYTNVTLYVPAEATERELAAAPTAPVAEAVTLVSSTAPAAVRPPATAPLLPLPTGPAVSTAAPVPVAGKLPSLTALPSAMPPRPAPAASLPTAPVVPVAAATAPPPLPAAPVAELPGYLRTTFNTLGSNAQGVVLLVRLPEAQFLKLPRNVFLNKLLQAINLVMADVVLVNLDGPYPVALENLRREIAAGKVLAFGKNLLDVAVRTTQIYEPVLFPDLKLSYLAAAEVEMVEYDVSLKKRLWAGLKAMFL